MFYNSNNWDLIAKIISKLQEQENIEQKIRSFKSLDEEKRGGILKDVFMRLGGCGFPHGTQQDAYSDFVVHLSEEELPYYLMEALRYMDVKLDHGNDAAKFMQDSEISVSPMRQLNKNAEELGIMILPKLGCAWSRKARNMENAENKSTELSLNKGINELMQNYYYINEKELGRYKIKNFVIKSGEKFHSTDYLRIAVSPLTNGDVLNVKEYTKGGQKKIGIAGVGSNKLNKKIKSQFFVSEDKLSDKVKRVIEESAKIQADILMFPEMLGTKQSRESALKLLAELDTEEGGHIPLITLLPTEWACKGGDGDNACTPEEAISNTNTLYVACRGDLMDGESYKASFGQQKQTPYFETDGVLSGRVEDIESDGLIYVLHVPNLGRITFPVCADLLSTDYRKMLIERLGATLVLCPSFSKGFNDFIRLTNTGADAGCRIVWCNSCAVRHLYEANSDMVFKESDICCTGVSCSRNCFLLKPETKCINGQCGDYCLFYIDIPLSMSQQRKHELCWKHLVS